MKHFRKLLAGVLCLCLLLGLAPASLAADGAAAPATTAASVTLTGNTGAILTYAAAPLSAAVDDNDLALVELREQTVRVLAREGAVGVARVTVETAAGVYETCDIPVGYTTFVFDGDRLTVWAGSSTAYEVSGINAADEEYLVGDTAHPLPCTIDADGNQVYENTEAYKLCVSVKKTGGTFVFTGTGADGSIAVKKNATGPAVLLLAGLELSSSFTAPLTVKKDSASTVTVTALAGWTSTLTDAAFNNADIYGSVEEGGDGSNAAYAESAVIKGKTGAKLTLNGEGALNLVCNTKNAVKVGVSGSLTVDGLNLNVNSVRNGLSSDNLLTVQSGTIQITTADGDCIRTDPDAVDPEAGCTGNIVIHGGVLTLQSADDGIQAAQDLTIHGGEFHITTRNGWNDSGFNSNTMSCKGLKASCSTEDNDGEEADNTITITGGSFDLNTADDAIHSDGYVVITGGEFAIQTGDDGVHADNQADFGAAGAADCAVHLTVSHSYEGLEAKNVYIHSGCYRITSSDDGINAAGGSQNGSDPSPWNPWNPGGPGGGGGDYALTVSGGLVNVNAGGDGLDSNGNETLSGGSIIVWGAASDSSGRDNSPLDCDGTLKINGATVFAAGSRQMATTPGSGSQPYVRFGSSGGGPGGGGSSISSGRTVVVKNGSTVVFSIKAPKTINYALYSAPTMASSSGWSITSDTSTPTATEFWAEHSYGPAAQTQAPTCTLPGESTALCACGSVQTQALAPTGHNWTLETVAPTASAEGYDLCTCALCGGQYRTNFTAPTGDPDPCPDGHTWDDGTVTAEPSCTEEGERTYTCTVCGATSTAAIAALGHSFDETSGQCVRCDATAYRATFVCSGGVSVTVFPSQDLTTGGVAHAETAFARSSGGVIDVSGSGQVNFLVVPEEGYTVESVTVTPTSAYKNLKGPEELGMENAYRVTKVTGDLTVTVVAAGGSGGDEWTPCDGENCPGAAVFTDMPKKSHWAHDAIDWAYTRGITAGVSANVFGLSLSCPREQVVTFLWAAAGKPEPAEDTENPFADVRKKDWFCKAVLWAVENGITSGVDGTHFGTGRDCTRAQVVTFLWAAADKPEPVAGAENPFADVRGRDWYYKAVLWAYANGVTNGTSPHTFSPSKTCTRAEIVTFLYKALAF